MDRTRPHLRQPRYGSITQGTVFSCVTTTRYEHCEVYGLTITARCDVAQEKYPILNYLPVVKLGDWLKRDGLDILVNQETNEQAGSLRAKLRQFNISENLLDVIPLENIAKVHFPLDIPQKTQKKFNEKFHEHTKIMKEFNQIIELGDASNIYEWFLTKRRKSLENLIHRLGRHEVLGYYLLEALSLDHEFRDGYVCLLREVQTLPRSISERIGRGIDSETYNRLSGEELYHLGLKIPLGSLAMPITEIASPTIEHILQIFSQLFGRIGVADPVPGAIEELLALCLTPTEGVAQ